MIGFLCPVRGLRRVTLPVCGNGAREIKKRASPRRIPPCIRHHGAVPLIEDVSVAGCALAWAIFTNPVCFVGRRKGRSLIEVVRRGFRKPVRYVVTVRRGLIDYRGHGRHGYQENARLEQPHGIHSAKSS
jgi:hypothetical protein